jgi:YfiH family protein
VSTNWIAAEWSAPSKIVAGMTTRDGDLCHLPGEPKWLNQVHGSTALLSTDPSFEIGRPNADAVISRSRGEVIAVRTADCLPVLLCSRTGDEVAAAHCGWRSLSADLLANTIGLMATPASELIAWFGAAISQSAFEVGDEVRDAFLSADPNAARCFERNDNDRWQADLYALARQKLAKSGVENVHGGGLCTYTDSDRFFSFRRARDSGRMISFIYRR